MFEYVGYFGALCIGLILGLTGAGGSILTVPILVYLMGIDPIIATGYSLFVVGVTSGVGAIQNIRKGFVEIKTAFIFALPSLTAVFMTRKFVVPRLPQKIIESGNLAVSKETFLMLCFAVVMLAVSLSMLRKKSNQSDRNQNGLSLAIIIPRLFLVGILIGLVGAGGGFLFIPVLIIVAKLPMRKAIGTSLLIIAINSLIGFAGDLGHHAIDWKFLFSFTSLAVIGILIGMNYSNKIAEDKLKKGFAWFVIAIAVFILVREISRL